MKKLRTVFGTAAFCLVFCLLFSQVNRLFRRKSLEGAWNHTTKIAGFYNEPENSMDLMFFGSSNTYCSFVPVVLWEKLGIKSYVFATQQQPVWASYAYMREALKTQHPKAVFLDVLMFSKHEEYYDDGVNFSFCDDLPFSKNKVELAFASAPRGKRLELLLPLIKYHTRYDELNEADFTYDRKTQYDPWKGYVLLEETAEEVVRTDVSEVSEEIALAEKELLYFHKIRTLCEKEDIPLVLVKTPSNPTAEQQKHYNTVEALCSEYHIPYLDFNAKYGEIGLELSEDFYDQTHLNWRGAEKFTEYLAECLQPYFPERQEDAKWDRLVLNYHAYCEELLETIS